LRLIDQQHDRQQAARADHNHMRGRGEVVSGFTHQAKEPMAMSRHIACLSFDLDAMSGWVARGMTTPTPISRGEFGIIGTARILALLDKYSITSTWFVPGVVIETYPEVCARIVERGHEIGHHGWTHIPPATLSRANEAEGLMRGNHAIEKLRGRPARGYRSPSWDLSPHTLELLLEQGFDYDSSMMGDDHTPYRARRGDIIELEEPVRFGAPTRLVEMPISWSLDDYPHFEFVRTKETVLQGLMATGGVLQNWLDDFLYMTRTTDWGVLTYTFHPCVIGRGHRMMMLERLILGLLERGVAFLTMEDAAD
jgi:peptidoglycan/xylan/chitin deacetylase (PgdA/CDA1 family)